MRCVWILLLAIGCYEAPDYNGTHFKCDAQHGCPDGQQCVNGFCSGGGGSGMIDAPQSSVGVRCGATTCTSSQKCCADVVSSSVTCISLAATCTGFAATCDGKEDCGSNSCCESGGTIACAATCTSATICTDNADCPTQAPLCCPSIGTGEPWGRCNVTCP